MSCTTDTGQLSRPGGVGGCPCGRDHPRPTVSRVRPGLVDGLGDKVYDAMARGRAVQLESKRWVVDWSGTCERPRMVPLRGSVWLHATYVVRCRSCPACLRARTGYWASAAMAMAKLTASEGRRTWFGTLTLTTEAQEHFLRVARLKSEDPNADFWDDPRCDERFARVRKELVGECQRYWKRLRKSGARFKYFLVFERHEGKRGGSGKHIGLPHMHFLLHEMGEPIRKRVLQDQWPWGFTNMKLVGTGAKRSLPPAAAAFYVAKYLSKSAQSRQIASAGYRPSRDTLCLDASARRGAKQPVNDVENTACRRQDEEDALS